MKFCAFFGAAISDIKALLAESKTGNIGGENPPELIFDLTLWYIRPEDLLDLELGFINLEYKNKETRKVSRKHPHAPSYMIVRLPQMHVAEETVLDVDADVPGAINNMVVQSYVSGFSYLVFLFNDNLDDFSISEENLLNWKSSPFFKPMVFTPKDQPEVQIDYVLAEKNIPGLPVDATSRPFTTFEIPYGLSLTPFVAEGAAMQFRFDNKIHPPSAYVFGSSTENKAEYDVCKRYKDAAKVYIKDLNVLAPSEPQFIEIWHNDIFIKVGKKDVNPSFKVTAYNKESSENPSLLPTLRDKRLLYEQFHPDKADDKTELSSVANDIKIVAKQVITSTGSSFRITPFGLTGSFEYISPDQDAILQKLIQQIRLGRDQYVEVQRLLYAFPYNIRLVEVTIGQRVITNGVSYIRRTKHLALLDKKPIYRSSKDEDTDDLSNSVLQRVTDHPEKNAVNYVRSCKRSFPFREIEVLTTGFIQIHDFENDIKERINQKVIHLQQTYKAEIDSPINTLNTFLQELRKQSDFIKSNTQRQSIFEQSLLDLSAHSQERDFVTVEFQSIINQIQSLKGNCAEMIVNLEKRKEDTLKQLIENLKTLQTTIAALPDTTVVTIQNRLETFAAKAKEDLNNVINKEGKVEKNIAHVAGASYRAVNAYWPKLEDGKDVTFSFKGIDWDGNEVKFESSFVCVAAEAVLKVNDFTRQAADLQQQLAGKNINAEMLFIRNSLLEYSADLNRYLSAPAADLSFLEAKLKDRRNELLAQAYKRGGDLLNNYADIVTEVKAILALKDTGIDEFDATRAALEQKINNWASDEQMKARHLIAACGLLSQLEAALSPNVTAVRNKLEVNLKNITASLNSWMKEVPADLGERWFQLNSRIGMLDNDLINNYHDFENKARRQVQTEGQKISYYKTKLEDEATTKINELKTRYFELSGTPIAEVSKLRNKYSVIAKDADAEYQRLKEFGANYALTYPQWLASEVTLPIVDNMKADATAIVGLAESYKMAGMEMWKKNEDAEKKNAEKVLFEIKQPFDKAIDRTKIVLADEADQLTAIKNRLFEVGAAYKAAALSTWESLQTKQRDYQAEVIGYTQAKVTDIFNGAKDKVGAVIEPAVVIQKISAIKGMAYTLQNDVNRFTGKLQRYSDKANEYIKGKESDINEFEKQAKDYVINTGGKIRDLLKDIKLFGIPISALLDCPEKWSPKEVPDASVQIKKRGAIPTGAIMKYNWTPSPGTSIFASGSIGPIGFTNNSGDPKSPTTLQVTLTNETSYEGIVKNSFTTDLSVKSFGVSAAGVINVNFDNVTYHKELTSLKDGPDDSWRTINSNHVAVKIKSVNFSGFLELIKQLQEKLGLGDGFLIQVDTSGIIMSYGIRIPTISTGAFTMSNMNLYAGIVLKFGEDPPLVRFAFGERSNPFTIAVAIYGGRGFFAMNVSSAGVELMESSLEFGGYLALDIAGIAKGQAYLMSGIYFRGEKGKPVYVESYITCGGSLSIIGLITVSVVFYLGMSWQNGALTGRASVEVSVKILFFSASYHLSFEKKITGQQGVSDSSTLRYLRGEEYLADNGSNRGGPNAESGEDDWPAPDAMARPYCFLLNESASGQNRYIPVYDPTLLYEHNMDYTFYVAQFGN